MMNETQALNLLYNAARSVNASGETHDAIRMAGDVLRNYIGKHEEKKVGENPPSDPPSDPPPAQ